ncbi:DUF2075 domain-containing protein [Acetobacter musti]|uniref:DUF2075 domain-containing protein n=1 Tax=Acetobacter musti TaxID=864732 RepID=A0ABX0JTP9_9PROT|nr:DUF2075 domain-containing protein [Acetobacter musti]NHN85896.1 DUF2075 domain-containing protein [Acetobacter musti]
MVSDGEIVINDPQETNSSIGKLSPLQSLTEKQTALVTEIIRFCETHRHDDHAVFVIEGDAGTGKSLVLNTAFNRIQTESRQNRTSPLYGMQNVLLVNHPEMIKLYRNISATVSSLRRKDYERPTTFINTMQKSDTRADIVFIDEAHLLLTRSDPYNRFRQTNQLEEILRLARIVILVFDPRQTLKFKSYWNQTRLNGFLHSIPGKVVELTDQFRVCAKPDVMTWIRNFCDGALTDLPVRQEFDFRIYDDAEKMYQSIREKNRKYGLCRILSTYDYPYTLNGKDHFVTAGKFHLRWDRNQPGHPLPWAERADSVDEVGSVYTVQGFDLNYAGVIMGPSVRYDPETDRIILNPSRYEDKAAFAGRDGIQDVEAARKQVMCNAIFVLLTRGIRGLYIYAADSALRARLHELSLIRK